MPQPRFAMRVAGALAVVAALLGTSACGTDSSSPAASNSAPSGSLDIDALTSQLPPRIRDSKTLIVATAVPYAPNEFIGRDGALTGFDVDVVNALAAALGLQVDFRQVPFEQLLPGVVDGTFDLAARSMFDTKLREQRVDMVTYFNAGSQWAQQAGHQVTPTNACGKRIGAQRGTVQASTELPAKSQACTIVGERPLTVVTFPTQDEATAALVAGKLDAVSADSPVIQYAVDRSGGKLAIAGEPFDTLRYGFPVAKGSTLGPVLRTATQHLIDSGELKTIADRWGLDDGVLSQSLINGAVN